MHHPGHRRLSDIEEPLRAVLPGLVARGADLEFRLGGGFGLVVFHNHSVGRLVVPYVKAFGFLKELKLYKSTTTGDGLNKVGNVFQFPLSFFAE